MAIEINMSSSQGHVPKYQKTEKYPKWKNVRKNLGTSMGENNLVTSVSKK